MSTTLYIDGVPGMGQATTPLPSLKNGYALDNSAIQTADRFAAFATLFDDGTIHHLQDCGVARGWYCLEVGGGGGSVAMWLSERVGPSGRVVVTDINTRFLDALDQPNLEVRQHNIVTDPLPEDTFDLIHARLVLRHLPEREAVLARLIKALKPGGWLLDEEYDVLSLQPDPEVNPGEAVLKSYLALNQMLAERGVDHRFGRSLLGRFRALGLAQVGAGARLSMGAGGSAEVSLLRSTFRQLGSAMIEGGYITAEDLEHDLKRLDDSEFLLVTPILWAAWGRRSQTAGSLMDAMVSLGAGI